MKELHKPGHEPEEISQGDGRKSRDNLRFLYSVLILFQKEVWENIFHSEKLSNFVKQRRLMSL